MSDNLILASEIAFLLLFWAGALWLVVTKKGAVLLRIVGVLIAVGGFGSGLFFHWEPYALVAGLTLGFIGGILYAEWHYDIRGLIALKQDLQRQRQSLEREERFQQAQRPWLDSERGELTYRTGPAAKPRA